MPTYTVPAKAMWRSKTLWFNLVMFAALLLEAATTANLPFVDSEWFVFFVLAVNAVLRVLTAQPLSVHAGDLTTVEHP